MYFLIIAQKKRYKRVGVRIFENEQLTVVFYRCLYCYFRVISVKKNKIFVFFRKMIIRINAVGFGSAVIVRDGICVIVALIIQENFIVFAFQTGHFWIKRAEEAVCRAGNIVLFYSNVFWFSGPAAICQKRAVGRPVMVGSVINIFIIILLINLQK